MSVHSLRRYIGDGGKLKYFTIQKRVSQASMLISNGGAILILVGNGPTLGGAIPILGGAIPILGGTIPILGGAILILGGVVLILGGALPILGGTIPILCGAIPILGNIIRILGGALLILGVAIPTLGGAILSLNLFSIYKKVVVFLAVCYCLSNMVHPNTLRNFLSF